MTNEHLEKLSELVGMVAKAKRNEPVMFDDIGKTPALDNVVIPDDVITIKELATLTENVAKAQENDEMKVAIFQGLGKAFKLLLEVT